MPYNIGQGPPKPQGPPQAGGAPQAPPTFADLSRQGRARPPRPMLGGMASQQAPQGTAPAPGGAPQPPNQVRGFGANIAGGGTVPGQVQRSAPAPQYDENGNYQQPQSNGQPGAEQIAARENGPRGYQPPQQQPATPGNGANMEQDLYDRWKNPSGFQAPGGNPALQKSIQDALANPSPYNSDNFKSQFDVASQGLNQQYNADYQRINEDMSRRGIYNSTIAGGRLGDLASNQATAKSNLATNMLNASAANYGQDRSNAIAQALGYGGQDFSQALQGYNANQGQSQQALQNYLGYGQQSFENQNTYNNSLQGNDVYNQLLPMLMSLMGYSQNAG